MSDILVLGTADWNQSIATNQHYISRALAKEHRVFFVESIGLRTPELTRRDIARAAKRLQPQRATRLRPVPENLIVISPLVFPRHQGVAYKTNRLLLHRALREWRYSSDPILWAYNPVTYGLEKYAKSIAYHCVDLLGEVDGISPELIRRSEMDLAKRASVAIGTSPAVCQNLESSGFRKIIAWPNVADTRLISSFEPTSLLRKPQTAIFAGNLSEKKVDFELLSRIVSDTPIELHLAGPVSEGGGSAGAAVDELVKQGATYHGLLSLDELAVLYWQCSVGLIPYLDNSYTRGVSPLKTFEYLAAGMPVVSMNVPSVQPVPSHVHCADSVDEFVDRLTSLAALPSAAEVRQRGAIAEANSWDARGEEARQLVQDLTKK